MDEALHVLLVLLDVSDFSFHIWYFVFHCQNNAVFIAFIYWLIYERAYLFVLTSITIDVA